MSSHETCLKKLKRTASELLPQPLEGRGGRILVMGHITRGARNRGHYGTPISEEWPLSNANGAEGSALLKFLNVLHLEGGRG